MESKDKSTVSNEKKLKYLKTLNLSKDKIDEIIKTKGKTKIEIYNSKVEFQDSSFKGDYFDELIIRGKCSVVG